jgi:hypothetical protein
LGWDFYQNHPFLSPPATLNPDQRLNAFVQDTLRGPVLASIPFFDRKKVVGLLDGLHAMDDGARVANDQLLMTMVSACVLHERFVRRPVGSVIVWQGHVFRGCGKRVLEVTGSGPRALERGQIFIDLAARLKSCPSHNLLAAEFCATCSCVL